MDNDNNEVLENDDAINNEGDDDDNIESTIRSIKNNEPCVIQLQIYQDGVDDGYFSPEDVYVQNMTLLDWEDLGRGITNNTHLKVICLCDDVLNDDIMSSLFRGLTGSDTVTEVCIHSNDLSAAAVRSMVPFIQNASKLSELNINYNSIQSEGLRILLRALHDSPLECLHYDSNGIESIEDDLFSLRKLKVLSLSGNNIGIAGCLKIAKLLNGDDAVLESLDLRDSDIDDECIAVLVESLRSNTSLQYTDLRNNWEMSDEGRLMLLRLVNDGSNINATLQSNHTLVSIDTNLVWPDMSEIGERIQRHIDWATKCNEFCNKYPEADRPGRVKLIEQLGSKFRAELAKLQGIGLSFYSEIPSILLPDVFPLIGRRHGVSDLFIALETCIAEIISLLDRKRRIQQLREHENDRFEKLDEAEAGSQIRSSKKLRA